MPIHLPGELAADILRSCNITAIASGEVLMSNARGEARGRAWPRHYTIVLLLFAAVFICFDIAPEYADVIWGISNTFATLPGLVSLVGAADYLAFGSGQRQID